MALSSLPSPPALADLRAALAEVADPEIPALTIEDLGVLRDVSVDAAGRVTVSITPTYSGCPALDTIRDSIVAALERHGCRDVSVRTSLSPAWSSDWISDEGRRKLREFGIAPPGPAAVTAPGGPVFVELTAPAGTAADVRCPRCGATDTREVSRFGSTSCKALWACDACLEPFEHFKAI
jgi:ring-1,2-phenylacetyl-CoA epoxidase subunit PaaD